MKRHILFFALASILISCSEKKKEETKKPKQYTVRQIHKQVSINGGSISTDDQVMLCSSNESGVFNAYEFNLQTGEKKALTNSTTESVWVNDYVPGTHHFIYSSDKGGDENYHLFLQRTDGSVKELTPCEKCATTFWKWSRDNKSFFYTSNVRDAGAFDMYQMDTTDWKPKLIYKNDSSYDIGALSFDEKFLTVQKNITMTATDLYLVDLKSGKQKKINSDSIESVNAAWKFSVDGKSLYYTTDEGSEFTHVMKYDVATETREKVFEKNWDISGFDLSYNETYRIVSVNEDAADKVYLFNNKTGEEIPLPVIENGFIKSVSFSTSENKMVIAAGSSKVVMDFYVYDMTTKKLQQISHTANPEIDVNDLVEAKVIRYKSFDGLEIPAVLYLPHQASATNKVPAVVSVHGGPGGQSRLNYSATYQYLLNNGYAVIAVNNRGSSGYGKTFYNMDNCNQGNTDLQDCIYGKKYMASLPEIDSTKIAIMGGSYGGYMVLAALCFQPEEFACGVEYFGVSNWMRTLKSFPPYWKSFINAFYIKVGNPNTADSVRLINYSPLVHADKIKKPLYVMQGANDVRVLKAESDDIVAAVKKNNVPVEYTIFPDEGHGFLKEENRIKSDSLIVNFLDRYLKGSAELAKSN